MLWVISLSSLHKVVGEEEEKIIVPKQSFTGENRKLVSKAHTNFHRKIVLKKSAFKVADFVYMHMWFCEQKVCVFILSFEL